MIPVSLVFGDSQLQLVTYFITAVAAKALVWSGAYMMRSMHLFTDVQDKMLHVYQLAASSSLQSSY